MCKCGTAVEYYTRTPEIAGMVPTCVIKFSQGMASQKRKIMFLRIFCYALFAFMPYLRNAGV